MTSRRASGLGGSPSRAAGFGSAKTIVTVLRLSRAAPSTRGSRRTSRTGGTRRVLLAACRAEAHARRPRRRPRHGRPRGRAVDRDQPVRRIAPSLPFGVTGSTGSASTMSRTSVVGRFRDQDLERRGILFHGRRDRHRVAGQDVLADAAPRRRRPRRWRSPVRTTSRTPQVCSSSSFRVGQRALGSPRPPRPPGARRRRAGIGQPEDRDDRVADDLLDRAAMRLEDGPHLIEIEGQDLAQGLGIEALAERRRALQVGVDDRRDAPDLAGPGVSLPSGVPHDPAAADIAPGISAPQLGQIVASMRRSLAVRGAASHRPRPRRIGRGPRTMADVVSTSVARPARPRGPQSPAGCSPGSTTATLDAASRRPPAPPLPDAAR